jgi:hypothetical protein
LALKTYDPEIDASRCSREKLFRRDLTLSRIEGLSGGAIGQSQQQLANPADANPLFARGQLAEPLRGLREIGQGLAAG